MVSGVVYCLHSVLSNSLYFWSLLFFILLEFVILYTFGVCYSLYLVGSELFMLTAGAG